MRSATKFRRHTIPVNIIEFAEALSGNSILHAPDAMPDTVGQDQRVLERSIGNVVFIHLILGVADLCRGILTVDCVQVVYCTEQRLPLYPPLHINGTNRANVFCISVVFTPSRQCLGPICQLSLLFLTLYRRCGLA